ncbi:hypothetical protein DFP72DRAFT_1044960 [Ephemerocybe angulata]|uniref:Uncharacterized protein n=1 Tax=Ephemerocybe angulata TaxID=980116 RepID=A0A8H6I0D5_9AGAR|nr:hypothetical protein DFP72DRAFT_1044960 [Tulosesus angulatus]
MSTFAGVMANTMCERGAELESEVVPDHHQALRYHCTKENRPKPAKMSAPTPGPGPSKSRKRDKLKRFFNIDRKKEPIPSPPSTTTKETRNRGFEGVKAILEAVVSVGDAFPPLKSTAAGMLVILKAVEAYGENREEFRKLLERLEVLSEIMASCPANVPQGVGDRFSGLARIVHEKKEILERRLDPTRSSLERVILSPQDKEEVLKITQEISSNPYFRTKFVPCKLSMESDG